MSDYSQYQARSEEWEAFIKKNPLPQADLSLAPETIREATNALRMRISQAELENEGLSEKATWRDYSVPTRDGDSIVARVYRPKATPPDELLPVYLYFHGGGHLLGSIGTEDAACARVAANAHLTVVHVSNRHTPEFKHPTQVNDAWDAFEWLSQNAASIGGNADQVIVGGISAGAGLAAYVVLRNHDLLQQKDPGRPALNVRGQLLCIPWLLHPDNEAHPFRTGESTSYAQNVHAAVLPMSLLRLFTDLLAVKDPVDPCLNVALTEDQRLIGLPKSSLLIAGQDLLRDEGLYYADKLKRNGVPTKVEVFPGLPHGFRRFGDLPSSRAWDDFLVDSCQWILCGGSSSSFRVIRGA